MRRIVLSLLSLLSVICYGQESEILYDVDFQWSIDYSGTPWSYGVKVYDFEFKYGDLIIDTIEEFEDEVSQGEQVNGDIKSFQLKLSEFTGHGLKTTCSLEDMAYWYDYSGEFESLDFDDNNGSSNFQDYTVECIRNCRGGDMVYIEFNVTVWVYPRYEIELVENTAISCNGDNISFSLTNSELFNYKPYLEVKKAGGAWQRLRGFDQTDSDVSIPYRNIRNVIGDCYNERLYFRVKHYDGTYSNQAGPFIFTLPLTGTEFEFTDPVCNGNNGSITIDFPDEWVGKTLDIVFKAKDSDGNNADSETSRININKTEYTFSPDEPYETGVDNELSSALFKDNIEWSVIVKDINEACPLNSDPHTFVNPTSVTINSYSVNDVITAETSPALPDGTFQATSTTGAWSAKLGISGGSGTYRKVGEATNLSIENGKYIYSGTGASKDGQDKTIYIEDINGCAATSSPTVNIKCPSPITITKTSTPATYVCGTSTTGFKYEVTGGVGPFNSNLTKNGSNVTGYTNLTINDRNERTISGLNEGDYVLIITDNHTSQGGNSKTYSFSVEGRNNPTFTATPTATSSCNGNGDDGSINLTNLSGHSSTYKYEYRVGTSGSFNTNSTTIISGKAAGTYQVKVTNSECSTTKNVTIPKRTLPSVTISGSVTDQVCEQKGSASFLISGHKTGESYTLQILNSSKTTTVVQNTGTASNSANIVSSFNQNIPGDASEISYYPKIIMGNDKGCESIGNAFTVSKSTNPLSSVTYSKLIDESCENKSNAVIQLTNTGNISGSYTLSGGGALNAGNHQISGLSASNDYNLTITEGTGRKCSHTFAVNDIEVSSDSIAARTSNNTPADCEGSETGSIKLNASNGRSGDGNSSTTNYDFFLESAPKSTQAGSNYTFSGLSNGTHNIKVVDDAGCEVSIPITIGVNPTHPVTINAPTDKKGFYCSEGDKGSFNISASTNNSGNLLSYNLSGVSQSYKDKTSGSAVLFNDLNAGTYTVTVTDQDANCSNTREVIIANKNYTPQLDFSIEQLVACDNAENGHINVVIKDSLSTDNSYLPFTYVFNKMGGDIETPEVDSTSFIRRFKGLKKGVFLLDVTDAFGCSSQVSDITLGVMENAIDTANVVSTPVSCEDAHNGTISITAIDGVLDPGHQYQFELFKGVKENNYYSFDFLYDDDLNDIPDAILEGESVVFENLSYGEYKIRISDSKGCSITTDIIPINIIDPQMSITEPIATMLACNGDSDASITFGIQNKFTGAQYKAVLYVFNESTVKFESLKEVEIDADKNTVSFENLSAGKYQVQVNEIGLDENNNEIVLFYVQSVEILEVTQPDPLSVSNSTIKCVTAHDGDNGSFSIDVIGGNTPYTYSFTKENESQVEQNTSLSIISVSNLEEGNYTFEVKDANGCMFSNNSDVYSQEVTITEPSNELEIVGVPTHESCYEAGDGTVVLSASGGWLLSEHETGTCNHDEHNPWPDWAEGEGASTCPDADYLYRINDGGWVCTNEFHPNLDQDNKYWVMDRAGNTASVNVTINARPAMSLNIINYYDATCPGYSNGRVVASVDIDELGENDIDYTVSCTDVGSSFTEVTNNGNNSFSYNHLPKGNYTLSIEDLKGCTDSKSFYIGEPDTAEITYDFNYILDKGASTGWIDVDVDKGNSVFDFIVTKGTESIHNETENTAGGIYLDNLNTGTYLLQVRDTAGCVYESSEWMERTIQIREPQDTLSFATKDLTNVSCKSLGNGYVEAIATGGWGNDYKYTLNGADEQSHGAYSGLTPGSYTIQITDTVGITRDWNFEITEPDSLTIVVDHAFNATCPLYANGRIETTVKNGIDFYNGLEFSIQDVNDSGNYYGDFRDFNRLYRYGKLPKGEYEITVRDSNACMDTDVFTIGEPDTAIINIEHNFIHAKGDSTGFINVGIENGNQWFDYKWYYNNVAIAFEQGEVSNALSLDELPAGEYKLMVRDTAGCVYEANEWMERTIEINEPEKTLRFNLVQNKPVSCFELSDGLIELVAEGGWGEYSWTNNTEIPQDNGTFNRLGAGNYTITITDSTGVSWDSTLVMIQPALLTASYLSHKDINCYAGNDGEIVLDVNGGNTQYFISLDGVNWKEDTMVNNLEIGTYNLYVKDEKECLTSVENITLTQPNKILVVRDTIIKSRCNNNEGIIQAAFNGGVGEYSYQWYQLSDDYTVETLLNGETNTNISNLYSGRYKVQVTDEHLCTFPFEFVVGDITDLRIDTIKVTPVTCFGYSDGNAKAKVINGNYPYFYSWPSSVTYHDNDTVWGLSSQEYELLIRDDKGCKTSRKFTVETPDPLSYDTISFTDPLCYGGVQGIMEVQAMGGTPTYNYQWSNGTAGNLINDVEPGTYELTLTDSHNCLVEFSVDFNYQRTLTPFIGNDTLICHYDSLIIDPGTYHTYSLVSEAGYQSTLARPAIKDPSVYYLQVTDADNCLGYDTLSLDVSYLHISNFTQEEVSCNKFSDGNAAIEVSPAGWNHIITWSDGSNNSSWNKLSGGDYRVDVLDDYGCKDSLLFSIFEPDTLNYAVTDILDPLCLGNFNGYIHGEVKGGVTPYVVNWNNGLAKENINELDTGYYRIDITDANNCFYQKEFRFDYRRTLMPFVGNDTLICHYNTLSLYAGNYNKFAWNADNGFSSSKQWVELEDPGTYYLKVTDKDKCLGFDTIQLDVSYLQVSDFKYQDVTCNGDADGWAQVEVSPADWSHTIEWTDGSADNSWTGLSGGDYNVRVFDAYGCEDNQSFAIYEPDAMALTVNKLMVPLCFGVPDGEIELSTSGGRTPYIYNWKHGENDKRINKLDTGYYFVDIYDMMNCHISRGFDLRYETAIYPLLGDDKVICEGNTVRLYPGYFEDYQWSNTLGNTTNDTAWVVGDKAEYYVEVTDDQNCVGRDTVTVDTRSTDLTPEFLMASSVPVGDTLMIIEVSQPKPQSFDWYFSGKHEITEQSDYICKVIFEEEGTYEIILNAHSYNCSAQARKTILVTSAVERDDEDETQEVNQKIISLVASPNPTDAKFNAKLELDEVRDAIYYLVRIENGQIVDKRKVNGLDTYNEAFNVGAPGVYAVFVEVGDERQVVKVVVQ